jgi:Protein of unknown function (DUF2863)
MSKKTPPTAKKKPARQPRAPKYAKDTLQLVSMSEAICQAASRSESTYWQAHLETLLTNLIDKGSNKSVMAALDYADADFIGDVADTLAEASETVAQTCFFSLDNDGDGNFLSYQATLFSVPIIAWSKYQIPTGAIDIKSIEHIHTSLSRHLIAADVQFGLSPLLYSIDALPQGFAETRQLVKAMADAIANDEQYYPTTPPSHEDTQMPADARFVLGVAISRLASPVFQWQAITDQAVDGVKRQTFAHWLEDARPLFVKLLPGCEFEMGMPNAFFHNCRQADIRVRPHSLRAVINGTTDILNIPAKNLTVVIAGVGETEVDEYRIGLISKDEDDVMNGAIWPLFASEDADTPPLPIDAIEAIVREAKIGEVIILDGVHAADYCEDCGAPFFFNRDGEAVHPFMPDDVEHISPKYH